MACLRLIVRVLEAKHGLPCLIWMTGFYTKFWVFLNEALDPRDVRQMVILIGFCLDKKMICLLA